MRIVTLCTSLFLVSSSFAQQVIYSEDFEGVSPTVTLNTTDAGSIVGVWNTWVINASYAGGDGDVVCLGTPLPYTIVSTPGQPGGITSANGKYLHTASVEGIADGILCCSFGAADGFCITADNTFSRMNTDVATTSADVTLSFWWLCGGGNNNYGQLYYSIDGGTSWIQITTPIAQYRNQSSWTQQNITLPEFSNQPTLRFGFRFHNAVSLNAQDPGFGIDDVRITLAEAVPNSISAGIINPLAYCQGAALSVPYTAQGTYVVGNIFSAELSDAAGGFASPTVIGTLSSTVSGTISCTIPALTPVGTGYRVRVVSSTPVTTGTANAVDISVNEAPFAGNDALVNLCKNSGVYDLMDFIPGASTCGTWSGPTGASFSGQLNTATDNGGLYTYTTNCAGGCPQDVATLTVNLQDPANAGQNVEVSRCATDAPVSLITYVFGGDLTGVFYYQGNPTAGAMLSTPGVYDMTYVVDGTPPCPNDSSEFIFTVNAAADAGSNTTFTICINDPAVQLITLLGGSPQAGGTWIDPSGAPFDGLLNPATDDSGLYTYLVAGVPPCADADAVVAVVVDPCTGLEEVRNGTLSAHWLGQEGTDQIIALEGNEVLDYTVLDATGRQVAMGRERVSAGRIRISMEGQASGLHVVRMHTERSDMMVRLLHVAR
ncbi:MAG: hypothetical protein ABI432_14280 [Flavobacteriales bacterium]